MSTRITPPPPPVPGEPAWSIAMLFPEQGSWSEEQFLALGGNRLIELTDGCVEVLPLPTLSHQWIVAFLSKCLEAWSNQNRAGFVVCSAYPVRLWPGRMREPDIVFVLRENASRLKQEFAEGADLVMEVVSEDRKRDLQDKRQDYAQAGISEYWIVDPRDRKILILKLAGGAYVECGEFRAGSIATSKLLSGFGVSVDEVFQAGELPQTAP